MNDERPKNIARLIIERNRLVHPFKIEEFARSQVKFSLEPIPFNIDALLVKSFSEDSQTEMIVNSSKPPTRQVFTIAHELGHVFIPWHVGEFEYSVDECGVSFSEIYYRLEKQADDFATELIAPKYWIEDLISSGSSVQDVFALVKSMGTSNLAASRIISKRLPPNHIILEVDSLSNTINYRYISDNSTVFGSPTKGEVFNEDRYDGLIVESDSGRFGNKLMYFLRISPPEIKVRSNFNGSSSEILHVIFDNNKIDNSERVKLVASINGICGTAKNLASQHGVMLKDMLYLRFTNRTELEFLTHHPLFDSFILKKYEEISNKVAKRRR